MYFFIYLTAAIFVFFSLAVFFYLMFTYFGVFWLFLYTLLYYTATLVLSRNACGFEHCNSIVNKKQGIFYIL